MDLVDDDGQGFPPPLPVVSEPSNTIGLRQQSQSVCRCRKLLHDYRYQLCVNRMATRLKEEA